MKILFGFISVRFPGVGR